MNKHPDIELLLKYANGVIEPALSIAIGLHQQGCILCQQRVAELESIAGSRLESVKNAEIDMSAFDNLLNSLDNLADFDESENQNSDNLSLAIAGSDFELFNQLANRDFSHLNWQKVTRKISRADVAMNDDVFQVEIIKLLPNAKIPKHTHSGKEFTLVLQGDFSDHQGIYKSGEFIEQDASNQHQPVAGLSGCVCLAITDAPLKFTGTFGPVINWFMRK